MWASAQHRRSREAPMNAAKATVDPHADVTDVTQCYTFHAPAPLPRRCIAAIRALTWLWFEKNRVNERSRYHAALTDGAHRPRLILSCSPDLNRLFQQVAA